ncbi:MAG TPA: 2Fe-2S iron-sulfur cluster binding domain-containing protein [Deltaproteobacteria bacterium]|nr:2Fe-2S iron-sulfur cluster binding domain-containing protein [Deltaproteobacteria bacterium]
MMISLIVDGKEVQVERGATILDAARKAGVYIPTLCHDSRITPYGSCRMCVVEDRNRRGRLIPSCFTPARNGMDIITETPEITAARRTQLQLILTNHPLDCPVCDKAGECALQDLVIRYDIAESPYRIPKKDRGVDLVSPLIERNMNRCILCGRCVRICNELQGTHEIDFIHRGMETTIGTDGNRPLDCDFCGQCISTCPVGALTDTMFKDTTRVWKLEQNETACSHCGLACPIVLNTENSEIRRVTPPVSDQGDIGNLCVRGRFGWVSYAPPGRLSTPRITVNGKQQQASWPDAINMAAQSLNRIIDEYGGDACAVLSSDAWTTEEAYAYQKWCRKILGTHTMGSIAAEGYRQIVTILVEQLGETWNKGTLADFENADAIVVIGGGAAELHPVLKPMINSFLKGNEKELVVISSWRDFFIERATLPIEINPELRETFFSALREALLGKTKHHRSDVNDFGIDCSALAQFVSLLHQDKNIFLLIVPYLFGDNEQLGQLAACLSSRVKAILPLGGQFNSRGALFHAGFSPILQPGGVPAHGSQRGIAHADELFKAIEDGVIRALYILGDDPLEEYPDPERIKKLLEKLDLLIYQSPYEGAVASMAHIVLPSATVPEKEGSVVSLFGESKNLRSILPMPDGTKSDLRILQELVKAMKHVGTPYREEIICRELTELKSDPVAGETASQSQDAHLEFTWKEETINRKSQDYPLTMIPIPSLFGDGMVSRNSPQLNELRNGISILMNPDDFEERSFKKKDMVRITTPFGSARGSVDYSLNVRKGTILTANITGNAEGLSLFREHSRIVPAKLTRIEDHDC